MEKEFGSWFHDRLSDWQPPNLNYLSAPFDLGQQNTFPPYRNPCTNVIPTNGTSPVFAFSGLQHSKASQSDEPCGWFYCLPRFRQAFPPVVNSNPKEKLPAGLNENCRGAGPPSAWSGCPQKRFLVFDQSGDQTTLIFSSEIVTPIQCLASQSPKPNGILDLHREVPRIKRDAIEPFGPFFTGVYNEENHKDDVESELHEDTEELNALLYSDDDEDDLEDDEETSTGHSPGTMTGFDKHVWYQESAEEVASSDGLAKRRKLLDGGYDVPSLTDTASSAKPTRCSECDDDAESSSGDGKNQVRKELCSLSGNKRLRTEKIRETVSILQSIIPGGKGKDAVVVLDKAINYLRSLKFKTKALGLDTL